jgi:hypothetical protein
MTADKEHSNSIKCQLAIVNLARQVYENYTNKEYDVMEKLAKDGFRFEPLWEMVIEELANTKCLSAGATGADFEDGSDAKLATLRKRRLEKSFRGGLKNLGSKNGHLRIAIFNPHSDRLDFFLIPPDHYMKMYNSGFKVASMNHFNYNPETDRYSGNLETYRVADVYEVCKPLLNLMTKKPTTLDDYMVMEEAA